MSDLTEAYASCWGPGLFEIRLFQVVICGDVRGSGQGVHQHSTSFIENGLLLKKKSVELDNKHSDRVDSHSGRSSLLRHVQKIVHSSEGV